MDMDLLTSDNPVCFNTTIGLGDPQSKLIFPISSSFCLYLKWDDLSRDLINRVTPETVDKINSHIARTATRFLYSANEISHYLKPSRIRRLFGIVTTNDRHLIGHYTDLNFNIVLNPCQCSWNTGMNAQICVTFAT